jgi:hypothetical protein
VLGWREPHLHRHEAVCMPLRMAPQQTERERARARGGERERERERERETELIRCPSHTSSPIATNSSNVTPASTAAARIDSSLAPTSPCRRDFCVARSTACVWAAVARPRRDPARTAATPDVRALPPPEHTSDHDPAAPAPPPQRAQAHSAGWGVDGGGCVCVQRGHAHAAG